MNHYRGKVYELTQKSMQSLIQELEDALEEINRMDRLASEWQARFAEADERADHYKMALENIRKSHKTQ